MYKRPGLVHRSIVIAQKTPVGRKWNVRPHIVAESCGRGPRNGSIRRKGPVALKERYLELDLRSRVREARNLGK